VKHSEQFTHKIFQVPYEAGTTVETVSKKHIEKGATSYEVFKILVELDRVHCECLLNNTDFLNGLRGFDLLVHDTVASCYVLLAEYLDILRVEIIPTPPNTPLSAKHMIPMPVSYVPYAIPGYPLTDKMTFLQRLANLGMYTVGTFFMTVADNTKDDLKLKYNIKPERSFLEAAGKAELVLITADFALEYPQPLLPSNIMVGQLSAAKEPVPLSQEFEEFVTNSSHGFIIVSFGSNVGALSEEKVNMLAAAFGKLRQRVVWRLKGYIPSSLSSNIKAVEWLPQNDLLAHKDIKAFVSHVGHNSLYESVYHGVPLVGFPLYGDQFFNAKKVEHFGLGLYVDHNSFEVDEMVEKIEQVISEPRLKAEATRISGLLRDRPRTPLETTGDWIEYVLRHGGARHLRAQVLNIPWYQYYLLDVMAFLVAVATLTVTVIMLTCRCLCRLCCTKSESKTKKE